ncbi:adenylate cyclase [Nocardioides alpinus]|uniref:Adenylate cyclase n=1 Tax=Nocardioides alpinus TaxID=748909 RepID=A0A1I0VEZ8_9ACTN|nr:response regulator [Nocardioides alpinus]PKH37221.1 adenylate/guanylate cyclase domain-containing response regulator [Nocardioides alpinus]SFA74560.1 adenylate cyclase [Nocardioides alpinus]
MTEERAVETEGQGTVLAVDDQPQNLRLLDAVLSPRGYHVLTAAGGQEALDLLLSENVDVVLLDVQMPGMDGCEVCRRIRRDPRTAFLPVVMITAGAAAQRLEGLEAGADDFITKPFDQAELLARVRSLARLKSYHDTVRRQAGEIAGWNRELEARVSAQVSELERVGRLRRFLSPQLADIVVNDEEMLASHRREIVVVFCDVRGFTSFAEASEPEEVMHVLAEYHLALGARIDEHRGTLERFTGDGVMVFFGDPVEDPDPAGSGVAMALAVRDDVRRLSVGWARRGHDLALGIGIAQGYATLGRIGYPGRSDYAAIGSVTNLAARLCSDATAWQVLVTDRILAQVEERVATELVGDVQPKGFSRPVRVHDVLARSTGS